MHEEARRLSQDPDRLFRKRVRARMTQQALADASGTSKATVSRLERGLASAEVETLHSLAGALGCPIDDLMPTEAKA